MAARSPRSPAGSWPPRSISPHQSPRFADCSGDGILAPLTGASFAWPRGPKRIRRVAGARDRRRHDDGPAIRFQIAQYDAPQNFIPPPWAHTYESCEEFPYGAGGHACDLKGSVTGGSNWAASTIHQRQRALRDELLKISYGVWDHLKNRCPKHSPRTPSTRTWNGCISAGQGRVSRRFVGFVMSCRRTIWPPAAPSATRSAYGGWSMDDHDPAGFLPSGQPAGHAFSHVPVAVRHPAPVALLSANVANLCFSGRDAVPRTWR